MNRSEPESNWQALPPLLVVFLLTIGVYFAPWPSLEGERPKQESLPVHLEGMRFVNARLWQDPFTAVEKQCTEEAGEQKTNCDALLAKRKDKKELRQFVSGECSDGNKPCLLIVGVMVNGGPYVGMEEKRRRTRYAVLAGLNQKGFIPDDPEHIAYVAGDTSADQPAIIPFEWLRGDKDGRLLLLLWLDEESLARDARHSRDVRLDFLSRLDCLLSELLVSDCLLKAPESFLAPTDGAQAETTGRDPSPSLILIGPRESGTLLKMAEAMESIEKGSTDKTYKMLGQAKWYSASATADEAWRQWEKVNKSPPKTKSLAITRVIAKDSELVQLLIDELTQRGVREEETVLLIKQWDTAYSRNLAEQLDENLKSKGVHTATAAYLRGIDGQVPGREKQSENRQNQKDNEKSGKSPRIERPEGDPQVDYLRRTAMELLRQPEVRHGKIHAVGIFGNDYHDKLLALKAMRSVLPEAIFFTTDLDAAMLHPGDNRHTRNLVVASAFDLLLTPNLQKGFPPFRDSYQTATFLATQIALSNEDPQGQVARESIPSLLKPLIVEIGRQSPVRLNNPEKSPDCPSLQSCSDPNPVRPAAFPRKGLLPGGALALIAGTLLAYHISRTCRWVLLRYWRVLGLGLAVGLIGVNALFLSAPKPLGEPFSWIEGISAWPTEILRILAAILSLALVWRGYRRLIHCDEESQRRFFGDETDENPKSPGRLSHQMRGKTEHVPAGKHRLGIFRRLTHALWPAFADERDHGLAGKHCLWAPDVWRLYRARQIGVNQLNRLLGEQDHRKVLPTRKMGHLIRHLFLPAVLFVLLNISLIWIFGAPSAPLRGHSMFWFDKFILFTAVFCFALLLFFVLESSRRASWLAEKLRETRWPSASLARLGMAEHPAAGKADNMGYLNYWQNMRLFANATTAAATLVYYPFLVFFVLWFSRSSLFDNWYIPLGLYLVFAVSVALMILAAWRLRNDAERMRDESLHRMQDCLAEKQGAGEEKKVRQIQIMIEELRSLRAGALAPISGQPIVRAVLGFAGSISGLALLEYASLWNL